MTMVRPIRERLRAALAGRYAVHQEVGRGGMASVFAATDRKHGRPVAIKVLDPELGEAVGFDRFIREIELSANLNHPHILPVHDSGEADGLLYFVMPYVEGESLRARLDREKWLPLGETVRIAREVGDALGYAHGRGIVHRDIKPGNILFQAGHALVTDFGIAQATGRDDRRLTRSGIAVGTLAYMSPEQLSGEGEVDERSDVYALGCVVHEMLTGSSPFEAETLRASLAKKLLAQVSDPSQVRGDVPTTVHPALERVLAVEPDRRFQDAESFIHALERATSREVVEEETARRSRTGSVRRAAIAVGAALRGALGRSVNGGRSREGTSQRVAVLPFENARHDAELDYFVEGAYTELVTELSRAVRVISPGSVARFADPRTRPPSREVASALDVDWVMTGRVDVGSDLVNLSLILVDGQSEDVAWSARYESSQRGVLDLYRQATREVADRIGVALDPDLRASLEESQEVDPEVYRALLQARFHWEKLTKEGIERAEEYYRFALSRDERSAEAWFGLYQVHGLRAQMGFVSGSEAHQAGAAALARAKELDPELKGIQAQAALLRTWGEHDWQGGEAAFRGALESEPTDSVTRAYYAQLLLFLGRDVEALAQVERAVATDPFNSLVQGIYGQCLHFLHRPDDAEVVLSRILERDPEDPVALSNIRTTYHLQGRHDEAISLWESFYRQKDDMVAVSALLEGHAAGGYGAALEAVAALFEERADPALDWQIATLYTRAGNAGRALDFLERAREAGDPNLPYASVDPIFDFMRDEPRFRALMDGLGL